MKVTNISKGPRGINTLKGAVLVEVGETVEVEVNEAEMAVAEAAGWFDLSGEAEKAEPELDRDELKKQAAELDLEYPKTISTAKLKELIDAKLAS